MANTPSPSSSPAGYLLVAPVKSDVPPILNAAIVDICKEAIDSRGVFTIALSGGSLPGFLGTVTEAFATKSVDPRYEAWRVVLADERCVPSDHADSNLGSLRSKFLSATTIDPSRVYGINEEKLSVSTQAVATDYESVLKPVLAESGGQLDLAVLGFGPDGHTCSLFPGHALLKETSVMVAPIEDSPKPPPKRITLTYPVLNTMTRHVIFCGAGGSKAPILQAIFSSVAKAKAAAEGGSGSTKETKYDITIQQPAPYPCAGVVPDSEGTNNTLTWIVDDAAMEGVKVTPE